MRQADEKKEPATAELAAREQELANARKKIEGLERDAAKGHTMLIVGCALVAITSIGLGVGAVVAVVQDTPQISTGGTIAAISAGALFATAVAVFVVNFYRKRVITVQEDETPPASNGSRSKPSASKPSSSKVAASKR